MKRLLWLLPLVVACQPAKGRSLLVVDITRGAGVPVLDKLVVQAGGVTVDEDGDAPMKIGVYLPASISGGIHVVIRGDQAGARTAFAEAEATVTPGELSTIQVVLQPYVSADGGIEVPGDSSIDQPADADAGDATGSGGAAGGAPGSGGTPGSGGGGTPGSGGTTGSGGAPGSGGATGTPANLVASASSLPAFGTVVVGQTSSEGSFTVTNIGQQTSGILTVSSSSGSFVVKSGASGDCVVGGALAGGVSCTVRVVFSPAAPGAPSALITFSASPGGSGAVSVSGIAITGANLSASASSVAFGTVAIGSSSIVQSVTITNIDQQASGILTLTKPAEFVQQTGATGDCVSGTTSLAGGGFCTVRLVFSPAGAAGSRSGTLSVSATPGGSTTASLSGTAVTPANISVTPTSLGLGSIWVGKTSSVQSFSVTNAGQQASGALTVTSSSDRFVIQTGASGDCVSGSTTLAGSASCTVRVAFSPLVSGAHTGTVTISATPGGSRSVAVTGFGQTVTSITAGDTVTCAALSNGTARCWGAGYGTKPVEVSGLTGVVSIAAGVSHTCALLSDKTVRCWGSNDYGQLGDGTVTARPTPVAVSGLTGVVSLALGVSHTCALLSDKTVRCWGSNDYGQLGDSTLNDRATPVSVSGVTGVVSLALGAYHTCALLSDKTVRCWGYNDWGQLGDTTMNNRATPVWVSGVTGVVSLAAGGHQTCAALSDTTGRYWGREGATTTHRSTPVLLSGLTGAVSLAAGGAHSCAMLSDGTARCWGYNYSGQLGDGTTTDRTTPVAVSGLTGAVLLTAGSSHTCALLSDTTTVKCWGNDEYGQLGDGQTAYRVMTPVAVLWQ